MLSQMLVHRILKVMRIVAQVLVQFDNFFQEVQVGIVGRTQHLQPGQPLIQFPYQFDLDVVPTDQADEFQKSGDRGPSPPQRGLGIVILELSRQEIDPQERAHAFVDGLLVDYGGGSLVHAARYFWCNSSTASARASMLPAFSIMSSACRRRSSADS